MMLLVQFPKSLTDIYKAARCYTHERVNKQMRKTCKTVLEASDLQLWRFKKRAYICPRKMNTLFGTRPLGSEEKRLKNILMLTTCHIRWRRTCSIDEVFLLRSTRSRLRLPAAADTLEFTIMDLQFRSCRRDTKN